MFETETVGPCLVQKWPSIHSERHQKKGQVQVPSIYCIILGVTSLKHFKINFDLFLYSCGGELIQI